MSLLRSGWWPGVALCVLSLIAPPTLWVLPPSVAHAQRCGPYGCSPARPLQAPSIAPPARPFAPTQVGGSCAGGSCPPPNLGLTDTEPFAQQFQPGTSFLGQPLILLQGLLRTPAFLAGVLTQVLAQQLLQGLFGRGSADITEIDPSDPRGLRVINRQPSLRARRGKPPAPHPGDFSVERLEQRGLVEERSVTPRIGPTETGPGSQQCVGGSCPAPQTVSPPTSVTPPSGGCPGGVCPRRR